MHRDSRRGGRVFGELYALPNESIKDDLRRLDEYEGKAFMRRRVAVLLGDRSRRYAWAYLLRRPPAPGARVIASGRY